MWLFVLYGICLIWFNLHTSSLKPAIKVITIDNQMGTYNNELEGYPLLEDFMTYKKRDYTKYVEKSSFFHHLQDERELSSSLFNNKYISPQHCRKPEDIKAFFIQHKSELLKGCTDFREFSHCQPHFIFQYDTDSHSCHSYFHEQYLSQNYTGVTLTLPLSLNRLDRLPLHFERWSGPMSISIQLNEDELDDAALIVTSVRRRNIRFTFYIVKTPPKGESPCTFMSLNRTTIHYDSCFAINVLRNLAIETIRTTHFMIIDGDGILSSTFEQNMLQFTTLLTSERELLLFPLIPYNNPKHKVCIRNGNCKEAWKNLPRTKEELLRNETFIEGIRSTYLFFDLDKWKQITTNKVIEMKAPRTMEPYGVLKRTRQLPLFHPYFINYGGNKEQYYDVLNTMDYHYNVMTMDFSVDLPHPPSDFISLVRTSPNAVYAQQLFAYFNQMFNEYCDTHFCRHFSKQYVNKKALQDANL